MIYIGRRCAPSGAGLPLPPCTDIFRRVDTVRPDDIFNELHENDGSKEENHDRREALEYSEDDAETSDDKGEKRGICAPTHL